MLIALIFAYAARRLSLGWSAGVGWSDIGFAMLAAIFYLGSRDTLYKYYSRTTQLLHQANHQSHARCVTAAEGAARTSNRKEQDPGLGF